MHVSEDHNLRATTRRGQGDTTEGSLVGSANPPIVVTAMCEHVFVTTDTLVQALDQLHGLTNATKLEFLRVLDELDRAGGWEEDGATSLENWVAYRYAMTWASANDHVATMRALRELPRLEAAFSSGGMSWEVLVMLSTFVSSDEDEEWADRAQRMSAAEVTRHTRKARQVARERAARLDAQRCLEARWHKSGEFLKFSGVLPAADGELFVKTLDRTADDLGPGPDGVFAPREQRLADALIELCGRSAAADADPDRATVVLYVKESDLAREDGKALTESCQVVSGETARRMTCDARVEFIQDGVRTRVSRTVPPKLLRALRQRDGSCVLCGQRHGCHAHHVKHWAHGGPTELDNLVLLCRRCHRLVHERGFRLARDRFGNVRLIRPDWRPVDNRPARLRPEIRERILGPPLRC
jgi:5-methylcytosine-specific restriction endonuclease McrA